MGSKLFETVKGKLSVEKQEWRHRECFQAVIWHERLRKLAESISMLSINNSWSNYWDSIHLHSKVAFWSERSIAVHCSSGGPVRIPYKVCIPVEKIKGANESWNTVQRYIEKVTRDDS